MDCVAFFGVILSNQEIEDRLEVMRQSSILVGGATTIPLASKRFVAVDTSM